MEMDDTRESCGIRYATAAVKDRKAFLLVLRSVSDRYSTHIICFDADKMAGFRHAEMAVRHACRSFREGTAISKSLEMESLLYAAGTRQCSAAVSFGLHEGTNRLCVCCCPDSPGAW
ncbi:MAG: KEOPS complex subunit Cgi121, partial [Methanoregula sp.]